MANTERASFKSAVHLIIRDGLNRILLQHRKGTKLWCDYYGLPAGHIDKGEDPYEAAIREAREELGIEICKENLDNPIVYFRRNTTIDPYYDVYFEVSKYTGSIKIMEPEKCSELVWRKLDDFDEDVIDYQTQALTYMKIGCNFVTMDIENR